MAKDKSGQEIKVGYYVFDTYSGEYGNVLDVGKGDFDDVKIEFLEGEAYCPSCEVEIVDTSPREKVEIVGLIDWSLS